LGLIAAQAMSPGPSIVPGSGRPVGAADAVVSTAGAPFLDVAAASTGTLRAGRIVGGDAFDVSADLKGQQEVGLEVIGVGHQ